MLIQNKNIIFLHIDRCSGTSIEKAFGFNANKKNPQEHLTLEETINYYKINDLDLNNYYIWGIVRNPFDKMISHYFHKRQNFGHRGSGRYNRIDLLLARQYNFNDWLKLSYEYISDFNINFFTNQIEWFRYKGNLIYNNICKFEDRDCINSILKKYNIESLPHINKSNHNHYREYYNEESVDLIKKYFELDLELFGYDY